MKCAFIGCYREHIGITTKQYGRNATIDIPTCQTIHWLILQKIWDTELIDLLFEFDESKVETIRKDKEEK